MSSCEVMSLCDVCVWGHHVCVWCHHAYQVMSVCEIIMSVCDVIMCVRSSCLWGHHVCVWVHCVCVKSSCLCDVIMSAWGHHVGVWCHRLCVRSYVCVWCHHVCVWGYMCEAIVSSSLFGLLLFLGGASFSFRVHNELWLFLYGISIGNISVIITTVLIIWKIIELIISVKNPQINPQCLYSLQQTCRLKILELIIHV